MSDYESQPGAQYLSSEHVIKEFYHHGLERLENATVFQVFLLACMAGGFIAQLRYGGRARRHHCDHVDRCVPDERRAAA